MKRIIIFFAALPLALTGCGAPAAGTSSTAGEELVSDGYMTTRKTDSSYAISQTKPSEKRHYNNIYEMLESVSGVYVNGNTVRIRGGQNSVNASNEPMFLVDGMEANIDYVNPNDVYSIDVIKDGSAAIYGMRGANGVILITTKSAHQAKEADRLAKKAAKEAAKEARKAAKKSKNN